jgi:NitT/TauT family transport system permease protein
MSSEAGSSSSVPALMPLGPLRWSALRASGLGLAGVGILLGGWGIAAAWLDNAILLPSPWATLSGFKEVVQDGTLLADVAASLKRVLGGFALAALTAVPLALLIVSSRGMSQLLLPVLALLRPIPPIAWVPIAILWFGLGDRPSYFVTAVAAFFPVFLNALGGARSVEAQHLRAARCLGARKLALLRYVYLPSSLPAVWTGLKIGLGQSWMAVVTSELVAAQSGLGHMIELNRLQLETPRVFVGMFMIASIGALMTLALSSLEPWIFPWNKPSV